MAAAAAAATKAAAAVVAAAPRRLIGQPAYVLLGDRPVHLVTFLAPKPNQPPTFATFKVPLTFNKFDLRDYLFHAYKTPVLAVRSQLRRQAIRRSKRHGRVYRPPPIKTMTVQLTQPFVWPRAPTQTQPWKKQSAANMVKESKERKAYINKLRNSSIVPLRDERKDPEARRDLKTEAKRLLKEGGWNNKRQLDPRFSKTGKAKKS
ncbi:hypothetical protein GGR51DRAFT_558228 [Nemania sp. FL0031]|nr:hypothetical protein GGR51DRAFT_558228 [Nemania sp. FL0031]